MSIKVQQEVAEITRDEFINEWVKDLRSGDFKQGKSYLERTNPNTGEKEHCCLGVACRTAQRLGIPIDSKQDRFDSDITEFGSIPQRSYLPHELADFLGMDSRGSYGVSTPDSYGEPQFSLTMLNDGGGGVNPADFDTIALVIASRPKGLFSEEEPEVTLTVPTAQEEPEASEELSFTVSDGNLIPNKRDDGTDYQPGCPCEECEEHARKYGSEELDEDIFSS